MISSIYCIEYPFEAGFIEYINHFFTPEEIEYAIRLILNRSKSRDNPDWVSKTISRNPHQVAVTLESIYPDRTKPDISIRNQFKYKQWVKSVHNRDGWKCVHCGSSKKLETHHIKNIRDYPDEAFDIDNGISLCLDCHVKIHKTERYK